MKANVKFPKNFMPYFNQAIAIVHCKCALCNMTKVHCAILQMCIVQYCKCALCNTANVYCAILQVCIVQYCKCALLQMSNIAGIDLVCTNALKIKCRTFAPILTRKLIVCAWNRYAEERKK